MDAKKTLQFSILAITVLTNCANPVLPSGGKKDSFPPKLLRIEPKGSVPKSGTITFTFDENINLQNPEKLVHLTTSISQIQTKASLNQLEVSFNEPNPISTESSSIQPQYLQILPGSIQDLNEKNTFTSPILISLEHPNTLDSNFYIGTVNNIHHPNKNELKAYFFSDTVQALSLRMFSTSHIYDKSKYIIPKNIIQSSQFILFIDDLNNNEQLDSNEYYALHKLASDSSNSIDFTYSSHPERLKLQAFQHGTFVKIAGLSGSHINDPRFIPFHPDTALLILKDTFDQIRFEDQHGSTYHLKPEQKPWKTSLYFEPTADTSSYQIMRLNVPIISEAHDTIIVFSNKDSIKQSIHFLPPNKVITKTFASDVIKFKFMKFQAINLISDIKLPTVVSIPKQTEKLGSIQFTRTDTDTNSYLIYLLSKTYTYTFYFSVNQQCQSFVAPSGNYNCIVATDLDNNKQFTRASIKNLRSEEPSILLQNISINPKLENTIIIKPLNN